jgi:small subunit ribosomal protein S9
MADTQYYGTGKRKTSVARVFLRRGAGSITVNGKPADEYFNTDSQRTTVRQPLLLVERDDAFDVTATVKGGGVRGQADALRHGIARALIDAEPELRQPLKERGYLKKERKKYGQRGARARFQFSKR